MITSRLLDGFKQAANLREKKPNVDGKLGKWSTPKRMQIRPNECAIVDFSRLEDKDALINQYKIAIFFSYLYKSQHPIITRETTANKYQTVASYDPSRGRFDKLRKKAN